MSIEGVRTSESVRCSPIWACPTPPNRRAAAVELFKRPFSIIGFLNPLPSLISINHGKSCIVVSHLFVFLLNLNTRYLDEGAPFFKRVRQIGHR